MDDLLVQSAQDGRADALVAPVRVEREGEEMGVGTAHPGHYRADQHSGRGHGCDRRLVLVESFDNVAPAVGRTGGGTGQVDEPDHILDGQRRVTVVEGEGTPGGGHRSTPLSVRDPC